MTDMAGSKTIDRVCCFAVAVMLILTAVVWTGKAASGKQRIVTVGYEGLFDASTVHTIDIEMADWDSLIASATQETYTECSVTIDGEKISNVGIRAKGNTSLSSVASMGSEKYSFKIEFDQFVKGKSYHGLDKLSLNNLIYDATMMKDYLAYTLMSRAGVPSPLCSYVQITVNGEPWGLYLAVEGVEDGFMERNNMTTGELYKPDSMSFGGGRGNGRDFDFEQFRVQEDENQDQPETNDASDTQIQESENPFGTPPDGFQMPDGAGMSGGFQMPDGAGMPDGFQMPEGGSAPGGFQMPGSQESDGTGENDSPSSRSKRDSGFRMGGGMFNFGMGSDDVKLQYIDDDPDSYANIFNNAKTNVGKKDKARLIKTLKTLSSENAQDAVFTDEVIRYLAVHDFLQNDDSYTGMMVHNYYLYEEDGRLAIIPWDYNLAFGGMGGGSDAAETINSPIDTPVSNGTGSDRPLIAWIFKDEETTAKYHEAYSRFIADTVENGWLAGEIARVAELIRPYVEADANSFYSEEEFDTGVEALQSYCALRSQSVRGQLEGTIPSTSEGQRADSTALVDAGELNISDMGVMNTGGGGDKAPSMPGGDMPPFGTSGFSSPPGGFSGAQAASDPPSGFQQPDRSENSESGAAAEPPAGNPFGGSFQPSFPGTQPQAGQQEMPESGFPGERSMNSGVSQTALITFGACVILLLAAILITAGIRGHNS